MVNHLNSNRFAGADRPRATPCLTRRGDFRHKNRKTDITRQIPDQGSGGPSFLGVNPGLETIEAWTGTLFEPEPVS